MHDCGVFIQFLVFYVQQITKLLVLGEQNPQQTFDKSILWVQVQPLSPTVSTPGGGKLVMAEQLPASFLPASVDGSGCWSVSVGSSESDSEDEHAFYASILTKPKKVE